MSSCLGSLSHEELDISIKMYAIFNRYSQVCNMFIAGEMKAERLSMATG